MANKIAIRNYWNNTSQKATQTDSTEGFIKPMTINSPAFTRIFGGNKIEITPKGNVDLSIMAQRNTNENPLLNERHRKLWEMDFDQNFNLNLVGKIGDRGSVLANFSSDAEFDFENQIKFDYVGREDGILQRLEIGIVSFTTPSRLMGNTESLFGIKSQLQIGKVNLTGVLSQKRSDSHEIIISNGQTKRELNLSLSHYEANQHYFLAQYLEKITTKAFVLHQ